MGSSVRKPRLLDLFCCEGGAAKGYADAGFEVVGVDAKPQPRYPFEFHQADAMTYALDGFDAVHASPPCQAYSITQHAVVNKKQHPRLLTDVRARLVASGLPFVIENVVGAPMNAPIELCGTMFNLTAIDEDGKSLNLKRHRLFDSNVWLTIPVGCRCDAYKARGYRVAGAYGGGPQNRLGTSGYGYSPKKAQREALMGIDWMTLHGLSQAIPPAYTEWIGRQLINALEKVA